ncbi:hypothetical protein P691DRAFT_791325 [Macrolepiota fuliginosa MF-IS2]|uniref:Uncharacterized protein n=1 Tax=Macrolepiota fuliginosa MF-IS2 TaxID=1400762 RepID=A0A9P5X183_9AGAR|nr:hypothetical protein P691DRAFT_791325 [Macrolepiota fuliginosa MF-IS2]
MVLEFGFLGLAYRCLVKPIPIYPPPSTSPTETKAIVTVLAVIWHTLAAFVVKDIILCVFGAECMEQYYRTGRLEPEKTDTVSRITTGLLVQISYFLTAQPTVEYRLAFVLALFLMVLGPLGPSVISPGSSPMTRSQEIRIANLTMTKTIMSFSQRPASSRASLIAQMELVEGKPFGYATGNNSGRLLVPWPEPGLQTRPEIYSYETDVVVYDYNCRWNNFSVSYKVPTLPDFRLQGVQVGDMDDLWSTWSSGIVDPTKSITPLAYPDSGRLPNETVSLSAFVFIADDGSDSDGTYVSPMDLVGTNTSGPYQGQSNFVSVASVLLCDPQFEIKKAWVMLSQGQLNATVLQNSSLIGNIPKSAAAAIFSQGLLNTLGSDFDDYGVGTVAGLTFLENDTSDIFPNATSQPRPFPLTEINQKMNQVIQSAAKAYISGYSTRHEGEGPDGLDPNFFWINRTASVDYQQTSLVSSAPFLVALGVLDAGITITLLILVRSVNTASMQLFSLQTLESVYHEGHRGRRGSPIVMWSHGA